MTISTTEGRILYTGNGSTTSFSVPFDFDADGDLQVDLILASTGEVTLQALTTDYTISTTNVVFNTAPASTYKILITYALDFDQDTNYVANDPFPAETHEDALDERVKQLKELKATIDYKVPKLPSNLLTSSTFTDTDITANYAMTINSTGDGIALQDTTALLDIDSLTNTIPVGADFIVFGDTSDSGNPKSATMTQLKSLMDTTSSEAIIHVDGTLVSTGTPTLDFDGTDFTLTESPTDDFDITIKAERIQDLAGAMFTGNTETGITITYQDADGTIDATVSDTTVAGDSGSTGITPGDTLTIAGGTSITTAMSGDTLTITNDDPATAEVVEDIVGGMVTTTNTETGITVTYQDATGDIDFVVSDTTVAGDTGSTGITPGDTLTIAGGTNITTAMSGDTLTVTNDYTDEAIEDLVGAMVSGNTETNITVTYQDADGTIDFAVPAASTTTAGAVELATIAETNTGTSTTLAVTPDGLEDWTGSAQVTTTGALNSGSITSGFGSIDIGSSALSTTGTITGPSGTWDSGGVDIAASDSYAVAGTAILSDSAGTMTLSNIDAIDATTETTLESAIDSLSNLTVTGTIATGTWSADTIAVNKGGTGQTSYTNGQILIGNTTGNTLAKATITGGTNLTVTNGTGSITLDVDDAFLANNGDTGTGVYDFGGATSFEIPNGATPTVDAAGEIAIDTTITDYTGLIKYHDGTEELTVVAMPTANLTTTDNHVVVYNAAGNEFKMEAQSGAGGGAADGKVIALGMILR
jgi:hypothetical protein